MEKPLDVSLNSSEQAVRQIREEILSGQIRPGERLKTAELATRLGLSTMPLREALRRLEGEGLVEIEANRGATVRKLDRRFISDLFELNTDLRICALRRFPERLTLERLRALEDLAQRYRASVEAGDERDSLAINRDFSAKIVEYGGNREALRVFLRGWDSIFAFRQSYGYGAGARRVMADEMAMLVAALRRMDIQGAEAILRMQNAAMMEDLVSRMGQAD